MRTIETSCSHASRDRLHRGVHARPAPLRAAAACGAFVLAACAKPAGTPAPVRDSTATAATASGIGPIPVEVDNRSSYDVILYAVRGSLRRRIGSVAGVSRTTVTVPASFTVDRGSFAITAVRLAGSTSFVSDQVSPQQGIRLVLTLQPRLVDSALSVQ